MDVPQPAPSAPDLSTKHKERTQTFKETENTRYIYGNNLNKAFF